MKVLVVDDEKNIRRAMALALESMEHQVETVGSGAAALLELQRSAYQVIFLDLRLQQESGLDVLGEILQRSPQSAVVIATAFATIDTAVEAMRRGAFDYLPKPCTPEQIRQVLARISRAKKLENQVVELETRLQAEAPQPEMESASPSMQRALEVAFKAARSDASVLILGESGTGKSILARSMHQESLRRNAPFVTVSCPSLSRDLLESDLFGHVKGSFTGAHADKIGKVAAAEGGTLFLDEIGDLPMEVQARLLRLLQEREYERVGDTQSFRADVRVISATNRDLVKAAADGRFREDLFYRLNVICITLPALRDRVMDLGPIAERQLAFFAQRLGKSFRGFSSGARQIMEAYRWPGNLRELRNVIERAVILGNGEEIEAHDLADLALAPDAIKIGGRATLQEVEREHIRIVMENSRTIDEAAHVLGIDPATLYRRKKKAV